MQSMTDSPSFTSIIFTLFKKNTIGTISYTGEYSLRLNQCVRFNHSGAEAEIFLEGQCQAPDVARSSAAIGCVGYTVHCLLLRIVAW